MKKEISTNEKAAEIMGYRPTATKEGKTIIIFDQPPELGAHCPVCKYENVVNGDFDERLQWSEYNGFMYCSECNKDYPSAFCYLENIDHAIHIFLDTVESIKNPL